MNGLCVQNKDEITFNKNSFNEMKKQTTKRVYVKPESTVIPMEYTNGLCKASVQPKLKEEDWKSLEEKDDELETDVEP